MRYIIQIMLTLIVVLVCSCESENMEEKYHSSTLQDSIPNGDTITDSETFRGKIAWFPFNGNLNDSTRNTFPAMLFGDTLFVDGINEQYGKGLYLNGSSYLLINLGYHDTLAIVFWIKGDGELGSTKQPVLFDYGLNALTAQLDGTSGATAMVIKRQDEEVSSSDNPSVEYLNSYYKYSFVYIEAGGSSTRVYYKGYTVVGDEVVYFDDLALSGVIEADSELLYIGRSSQRDLLNSSNFFNGAIDEIQIYNKTLSSAEVEALALIPTN
jgi:hypothetical protein